MPLPEGYGDIAALLDADTDEATTFKMPRRTVTTGRPIGDRRLENPGILPGKPLKPQKLGPKGKIGSVSV